MSLRVDDEPVNFVNSFAAKLAFAQKFMGA